MTQETLPVVGDLQRLLRRLALEEEEQRRVLAHLEDRVRRFEDSERPAYESWLRLELGPLFTNLGERVEELRARRIVADRVMELVDRDGLHPREALHLVINPPPATDPRPEGAWSREEIEARRRAKIDRKRAQRKQTRRGQRSSHASAGTGNAPGTPIAGRNGEPSRPRMTELYRALARRLHPDSPTAISGLDPGRVRTIWVDVQAAYSARSLERMLAISAWLEMAAAGGTDAGGTDAGVTDASAVGHERRDSSYAPLLSLAERHEHVRALGRSRRALERRLAQLEREPAWGFETASTRTRRHLKQAATRGLEDELDQVRNALDDVEDFFKSIGSPRPPRQMRGR